MLRSWCVEMARVRRSLNVTHGNALAFPYSCFEDYAADRGTLFEPRALTGEEHEIVANATYLASKGGCAFALRECFYNAQWLVLHDASGRIKYHEGIARGVAVLPVLHAWASIGGAVVDLTWRTIPFDVPARDAPLDRVVGDFDDRFAYLGVEFDRFAIRERVLLRAEVSSFVDDWRSGFPELQRARLSPVGFDPDTSSR